MGWTPYSHVYIRVYSKMTGWWIVYQASHGMVHCMIYDTFKQQNYLVKEFEHHIEPMQLVSFLKTAQSLLGRPYGYWGLVKLALKRWGWKTQGDDDATFHCSELIARLVPSLACGDIDFIEPVHLYDKLDK